MIIMYEVKEVDNRLIAYGLRRLRGVFTEDLQISLHESSNISRYCVPSLGSPPISLKFTYLKFFLTSLGKEFDNADKN